MTRSDEERFADILNAIDRCQNYEQYLRSEEFGSMAYDAVLRNLGVNGEAVRALPPETRDAMPDVPWASIAGLRNIARLGAPGNRPWARLRGRMRVAAPPVSSSTGGRSRLYASSALRFPA